MNRLKGRRQCLQFYAVPVLLYVVVVVGCNHPSAIPVLPIEVESPQHEGGTLLFSDLCDAEHAQPVLNESFKIRNASEEVVNVELVAVNCSCVTVVRDGNPWATRAALRLPSGETSAIGLRRDVSTLPGTHRAECILDVVPASDGARRSTITLSASVNVYADVSASPKSILVSFDGRSSPPVVRKLSVQHVYRDGRPPGEPRIAGLPAAARVERLLRSAPTEVVAGSLRRDTWAVELSFSDSERDMPPLVSGIATISFPGPDGNAEAKENFSWSVSRRYGIAAPTHVDFGSLRIGQPKVRRIALNALDGTPFRIVEATADSEQTITAVPDSTSPQRSQWLTLRIQPKVSGKIEDEVRLSTDHPSGMIALPIRALVTE